MDVTATVRIDFDEELGTYWIAGVHLPANCPEIAGLSNVVFEYRDGRLVASLRQYGHPCHPLTPFVAALP